MTEPEAAVTATTTADRVGRAALAIMASGVLWLVVFYVLFWRPPGQLDEIADKLHRCAPADGEACIESSGATSLGMAGWLPWTERQAGFIADDRDYRQLELRVSRGDGDVRAEAVAMLGLWRHPSVRMNFADPFFALAERGAYDVVVAHAADAVTAAQRDRVLVAAMVVGDTQALAREAVRPLRRTAAEAGLGPVVTISHYLHRGALLCLLGHGAEGVAALRAVDHMHGQSGSFGWRQSEVAQLACGAPSRTEARYNSIVLEWDLAEFELGGGALPGSQWTLLHQLRPVTASGQEHKLALLAQAVAEAPVDAYAVLATLFAESHETLLRKLAAPAAKMNTSIGGNEYIRDPRMWSRAADRVAKLAHGPLPPRPAHDKYQGVAISADALAKPAEHLRIVAGTLRFVAASDFAAMGKLARGRVSLRKALAELTPGLIGPLLARPGDPDLLGGQVLRLIQEKGDTDLAEHQRAQLYLTAALYLQRRGKLEQARTFAARALALAQPLKGTHVALRTRAAWVVVALALRAGKATELSGLPQALYSSLRKHASGSKLRAARFDLTWFELPAFVYAVAKVAPRSVEPIFGDAPPLPIHRYQHARAEAARWAGDKQAQALWTKRAQRLEALLGDFKALVLARVAGL